MGNVRLSKLQHKDIDPLAQKVNVNPEMVALYDEKCKQLKGVIDDKLRDSCIRARFLYVNETDTSSKYFFKHRETKGYK